MRLADALGVRARPGDSRRLPPALLVSLLLHGLLLSLIVGGEGQGLPGFGLPWQERRSTVPELQVVLAPSPTAATVAAPEAAAGPRVEPEAAVPMPPASAPTAGGAQPEADWSALVRLSESRGETVQASAAAAVLAAADKPLPSLPRREDRTDTPAPAPPPVAAPRELIALAPAETVAPLVPVAPALPSPAPGLASGASFPTLPSAAELQQARDAEQARLDQAEQARLRQLAQQQQQLDEARRVEETARREAVRQDALRAEAAARMETQRQEEARQAAARQELSRQAAIQQEAIKQEMIRQEAARQDALRQEAALAETARLDAERREAARQAAARQEASRQEALRQEAGRQEAARAEAARQDAARQEAARLAAIDSAKAEAASRLQAERQEAEARREARLRAIGQQLNEEADRRSAGASSLRRGRLFGRSDANNEMVLYAEAWARKIQLNQTFEQVREALKQPHTDPMVTVALRSDGTVESVSFVRSSGAPALDEAIRRVVQGQAPYPAFAPNLAREFDVIEIRRTWRFDTAIRLE